MEEGVYEGFEDIRTGRAQLATGDHVDDGSQWPMAIIQSAWIVAAPLLLDLMGVETKDEHVFYADLLGHLYVGPIHGPDGQRSIEGKLHVSRSGSNDRSGDRAQPEPG